MLSNEGIDRLEWHGWLQASILGILIAFLYHRVITDLVVRWWKDPNYFHGFIVVIFSAWVLWKERRRLADEPAHPSWHGLVVVCTALGILLLGMLGAEQFLSRTSLLFLLAGLVIYFRGWRYFRIILFPWAVLFLAVPVPMIIFNRIALPLQFLASRLASSLLSATGVPTLCEGNVIILPSLSLDVEEACSGLRSLVLLITLSVLYGYVFEPIIWRRILLILSSIPIAITANALRIMGSGILGEYWNPDKAEGFFHRFSGLLIFAFSFGLLLLFHAFLGWTDRRIHARSA